jgi:hypothetical protein
LHAAAVEALLEKEFHASVDELLADIASCHGVNMTGRLKMSSVPLEKCAGLILKNKLDIMISYWKQEIA